MARIGISTGTSPNDGQGDSLLIGAIKINQNFTELYSKLGDGTNLIPPSSGNTYYVTENGNNSYEGNSLTRAFSSINQALTVATSGDTVNVGVGTFTEDFPLVVPSGVTVRGSGLRATFIQPTVSTKQEDGFVLNGDTTVEDLSIGNFYEPGYGFKFANNCKTINRSPYVQRVTVLNKGSGITTSDPYGFDTPHAPPGSYKSGKGILIDGSVCDPTTLEPAMLFNECTFICPNNTGLEMTNGGRTEWVNCFTYLCDKGIYAHDGSVGLGSTGTVKIKTTGLTTTSTTPDIGDELYYLEVNTVPGTYSQIGTSFTITKVGHGLTIGDRIYADFTSGTAVSGFYPVTGYVGINTFAITVAGSATTSGNVNYKEVLGFATVSSYSAPTGLTLTVGKGEGLFELPSTRISKSVIAYGNASLSSSQEKFGTSSLLLDGTGDYVRVASNSDFNFGTGDFTVECWVYPTEFSSFREVFDFRTNSGDSSGIIFGISNLGVPYFYYNGGYRIGPAGTLSLNTWHHLALSRSGTSTKMFVDGTQVGSTYTDNNNYPVRGLTIGSDPDGNFAFKGHIDEFRVTKGLSRYDTAFTPSTSEFSSDGYDKLLLHFNGVTGSTSILDSSLPTQDIRWVRSGVGIATATKITLADYQQFGAEMRSIGSASVFGNSGITVDGPGCTLRLFAYNFGHIGSGKDFSQDISLTNQPNEVISFNNGKAYFVSIDQSGDFRVGDAFYVSQESGTVNFGNQEFTISSLSDLNITDGANTSTLTPTTLTVGGVQINNNNVTTTSGDLILNPSGISSTTVEGELNVNGNSFLNGSGYLRDNDKLYFGNSLDLEISHDGNNSYIKDTGTGSLIFNTNNLQIKNDVNDEFLITTTQNGSVELYYDNSNKLNTTGYGVTVFGSTYTKNVIENVVGTPTTTINVVGGTLTIDLSAGSVLIGDMNASVTTWAFTNFPSTTEFSGGMMRFTFINDGDVTQTYGDTCTVNGVSVTGGIKWQNGSAPSPTNNFDIITFMIVRGTDNNYSVFASAETNYS